jgi:hypothetical protein
MNLFLGSLGENCRKEKQVTVDHSFLVGRRIRIPSIRVTVYCGDVGLGRDDLADVRTIRGIQANSLL